MIMSWTDNPQKLNVSSAKCGWDDGCVRTCVYRYSKNSKGRKSVRIA